MNYIGNFDKRFDEIYFTLSIEDIYHFEKKDNGAINNVLSNLETECFGVFFCIELNVIKLEVFYINKNRELKGDILCVNYNEPYYFELLLRFCHELEIKYPQVHAIDAFNTFQSKVRTFIEKSGYFTVSNLELPKIKKGENIVGITPRKAMAIQFIDKVEFYRDFFKNAQLHTDHYLGDFIYLMINTETSMIKIGFSKNPKYREGTLQSKEPKIHLIASWKKEKKIERELHNMFRHKRIRGEWFKLNFSELKALEDFMTKN